MSFISSNGRIKLGNSKLKINNSFDILPAGEELSLSFEIINNRFIFSIDGVDEKIKEIFKNGKPLVLNLKSFSPNSRKMASSASIDGMPASIDLKRYTKTNFKNMDLTEWIVPLLYRRSILKSNFRRGIMINQSGTDLKGKVSTGHYYTKIEFNLRSDYTYKKGSIFIKGTGEIVVNFYNIGNPFTQINKVDNDIIDIF